MAVVERLLFIYLRDDLGASNFLCGLTVTVTVIFELPIFMYADQLLKLFGHHGMFLIAMVAHTVRVFLYTLLTREAVYAILPIEITHGITFACMWTAAVEYAKMGVPEEWSSAAQSILAATLGCVGAGVGSILGGYVMDRYGAIALYTGTGIIGLCTIAMHLAFHLVTKIIDEGAADGRHSGGAGAGELDDGVTLDGIDVTISGSASPAAADGVGVSRAAAFAVAETIDGGGSGGGVGAGGGVREQVPVGLAAAPAASGYSKYNDDNDDDGDDAAARYNAQHQQQRQQQQQQQQRQRRTAGGAVEMGRVGGYRS